MDVRAFEVERFLDALFAEERFLLERRDVLPEVFESSSPPMTVPLVFDSVTPGRNVDRVPRGLVGRTEGRFLGVFELRCLIPRPFTCDFLPARFLAPRGRLF